MTVLLQIKDNDGTLVYDLLRDGTSTNISVDYASIVLNPIDDGIWEISYRMLAGVEMAIQDIQDSIYELDQITYQVNRYGEFPGSTPALWLHEKTEAESTERRAILTSASFQPTWEGSVGALIVNGNGWVGLFRLTRGDWEELTVDQVNLNLDMSVSGNGPPEDIIEYFAQNYGGTKKNRIRSSAMVMTDGSFYGFIIGLRPENSGTTNYQPVGNMGRGLYDKDGNSIGAGGPASEFEMIPYVPTSGYTWNELRTNPTYVGYNHNLTVSTTHTHYLRLEEITGSTLDSFNDDYVGEYEIFVRFDTPQAGNTEDAYYKFRLGIGDTSSAITFNDPIYHLRINRAFPWFHLSLGRISLPLSAYVSDLFGPSSTRLSEFVFALETEIIGTPLTNEVIKVDSIFLMPVKNYSITTDETVPNDRDLNVTYGSSPTDTWGLILDAPYYNLEVTGQIEAEPGDATLVVLKQVFGDEVQFGTLGLIQQTYKRYNTIKP